MAEKEPVTDLDARYSSVGATATAWADARKHLEAAELWWIVTVRSDGRPHVTPLLTVWSDGALHFCTGPEERKARNLRENPHCILLTGSNTADGLDLVVEGDAVRVTDDTTLRRLADLWVSRHGTAWRFTVSDGAFHHAPDSVREDDPGAAWVYRVDPATAFGFGKGETYSQTRWRFSRS